MDQGLSLTEGVGGRRVVQPWVTHKSGRRRKGVGHVLVVMIPAIQQHH
jgi:hypothetical protein